MTDELTSTGLNIDDLQTRTAKIVAELRAGISSILDVSASSPMGQLTNIFAEHEQQLAELIQDVYTAFDPDQATGQSLDALSSITGTYRRAATQGLVTLTLNLDAATTVPAGSQASVSGDPDNVWETTAGVTSVGKGNYDVVAECTTAGSIEALAGTITVIVTPVSGWNTVDNDDDATEGLDRETDTALRLRREIEITQAGSTSVDSIHAAISAVTGVISAVVYENDNSVASSGRPPHSFEVCLWDGSPTAAADADIAEAIFDSKAAGIVAHGSTLTTHTDDNGQSHNVRFSRATEMEFGLEYTLVTNSDYPGNTTFRSTIVAWADANLEVGEDVSYARFIEQAFSVAGVEDVTLLRTQWEPDVGWGSTNLVVAETEIATLDSADIDIL